MRSRRVAAVSMALTAASAIVSAAGLASSASAAVPVGPTDIIVWGGVNQGRAVPGVPSGSAYVWNNSAPGSPSISASGRVYFNANFVATPQIGTVSPGSTRAMFTATNSTDLSQFLGFRDGNTDPNNTNLMFGRVNSSNAFSLSGVTGNFRVAGEKVANIAYFMGPGVVGNSTAQLTTNNNTAIYVGDTSGSSQSIRQLDALTLFDNTNTAQSVNVRTPVGAISTQFIAMNSSGAVATGVSVVATAQAASPAGFINPTATATVVSNGTALVYKASPSSPYVVVAQSGQQAPGGFGAGLYRAQSASDNGVGGFYVKLNRNGQLAYSAKLVQGTQFVTASNDDAGYIYDTNTSTTVRFYREGAVGVDASGAPDAGGAVISGSATTWQKSFSNAGQVWGATLSGGDVSTTAGSDNSSALYRYDITTNTNARLWRRNDVAFGFAPTDNVRMGFLSTSNNVAHNNSGQVAYLTTLQGSGVFATQSLQTNGAFPPSPQLITQVGRAGNDMAIYRHTGSTVQMIARSGDLAPGFDGGYRFQFELARDEMALNNNGDMLFSSSLTPYAPGQTWGTVGQNVATVSILPSFPRVLFGFTAASGVVPLLYEGMMVEVETGVFKTIQSYTVNLADSGDGGTAGLSDNGFFTARLVFTDNSWAVTKLAVPAPSTGVLAGLGMALAARRRRK